MLRRVVIVLIAAVAAGAIGVGVWWAQRPQRSDPAALRLLESAAEAQTSATLAGEARTLGAGPEGPERVRVKQKRGKMRVEDSGATVLDDGKNLYRLNEETHTAQRYRTPEGERDLKRLSENYVVARGGQEEVAGRKTTVVEMHRRGGGVARRLWIDDETHVVLRQEAYDRRGRVRSGMVFERVDYEAEVPDTAFEVPEGWEVVAVSAEGSEEPLSLDTLSKQVGFEVRPPGYVPEGFAQMGAYARRMGRHGMPAAELRYGDGLRRFSVYQHVRAGRGGPGMGPGAGRGRRHGGGGPGRAMGLRGGRAARLEVDGRVVVVVGDLAPEELARIAKSVK